MNRRMLNSQPMSPLPDVHHRVNSDVVLLGASNLTLCLPRILRIIEASQLNPVHVWAAHGHGRSYGNWSSAFIRSLPGIRDSQLWQDLDHKLNRSDRDSTRLAVITDIGNDLIYGTSAECLLEWIHSCLERLENLGFQMTLTQLPLESLRELTPMRFRVAKSLFFPTHPTTWEQIRQQVEILAPELNKLCERSGRRIVVPPGHWYGMDPIHIRRSQRLQAWQMILDSFPEMGSSASVSSPRLDVSIRHWLRAPAERRLLGLTHRAAQPTLSTARLRLSVY